MKKICMIVLDGFGYSNNKLGNAVNLAPPINFLELLKKYPHSSLHASGKYVGLDDDEAPTCKLSFLTLGAGRLIKRDNTIVSEFLDNPYVNNTYKTLIADAESTGNALHVIGLLSNAKRVSNIEHFLKLLDSLKGKEINLYFHLISDGLDCEEKAIYTFITTLENKIKEVGVGKIASITGRRFAMDNEGDYEKTKRFYDLITKGIGFMGSSIPLIIQKCYQEGITDQALPPIKTDNYEPIKENDSILFLNYENTFDIQILESLTKNDFDNFKTQEDFNPYIYTLFPVPKIKTNYFLEKQKINNNLGVYLSKLGLTQARIAENYKFEHVTYYFDGESSSSLEGATKFNVPSREESECVKNPEMSAVEITKKITNAMKKDYDFILADFANPDILAHTGNLDATIKGCVAVDLCLKMIKEEADDNFYTLVILGDHGNADQMLDEKGNPNRTHTTSDVPFIITDEKVTLEETGTIAQVAPTILKYMDIAIPKEMSESGVIIK